MTARTILPGVLTLLFLMGCGKREGQLTGTVTYKGKPVQSGEMLLMPDQDRGNFGPAVQVEIKDGVFKTPSSRGHWGGPYLATISIFKGSNAMVMNYEMPIDLPQGDASFDIVVPDKAGAGNDEEK